MRFLAACILSAFLFVACSGDSSEPDQPKSLTDQTYERLSATLTFGETDDVFFQRIGDFFQAEDGRFFLLDSGQRKIFIYDSNGSYLTSFGREGRGPLEFEQPLNFFMDENGLLYVYDFTPFAVKVFRENSPNNWEYKTSFAVAESNPAGLRTFPIGVVGIGDGLMAAIHRQGFSLEQDDTPVSFDVNILNKSGEQQFKHALELPSERMIIVQGSNTVSIRPQPLGYSQHSHTKSNGIHYFAFNQNNKIYKIDLSDSLSVAEVWAEPDLPRSAYTREEVANALEIFEGEILSQAREGIPELRPGYNHFVVCDNGLLWIRHESYNSETNESRYVIFNPATKTFERFISFEGRVRINKISNNRILARHTTEDDLFEVKVFEL